MRYRALTHFYTDYGRELQLRFFDYFARQEDGWDKQPKVQLQVRHPGERFVERAENEWPLKRTKWTKLYLDPASGALTPKRVAGKTVKSFQAVGDSVTFLTEPLKEPTEIRTVGGEALRIVLHAGCRPVRVRVFTGDLEEVVFQGTIDPHTDRPGLAARVPPQADKKLSTPYRLSRTTSATAEEGQGSS